MLFQRKIKYILKGTYIKITEEELGISLYYKDDNCATEFTDAPKPTIYNKINNKREK